MGIVVQPLHVTVIGEWCDGLGVLVRGARASRRPNGSGIWAREHPAGLLHVLQ